ncbi:MAG: hypothetical protein P8Y47_12275, partial [Alphaproteobacteria bacterium]
RETEAFGKGLERHGWNVQYGETRDFRGPYDLICQWNTNNQAVLDTALREGTTIAVVETSYLEPRSGYCSIGFGVGVNNRLEHFGPFEDDSRFMRLHASRLLPWKVPRPDDPVVIMGQLPNDQAVRPYTEFYEWVYTQFKRLSASGEKVLFRQHPKGPVPEKTKARKMAKICFHHNDTGVYLGLEKAREKGMKVQPLGVSMAETLDNAKYVVTFNSNSATDALMFGVRAVAMDEGSMSWPIVGHDIDDLRYPDRKPWAQALSWMQWTAAEMESGACWDAVCPPHLGGSTHDRLRDVEGRRSNMVSA